MTTFEKGSFVHLEQHPEYGVGRVVWADSFATRVLFPGGLRVYRTQDVGRLKRAAPPSGDVVEALAKKEAEVLGSGGTREPAATSPVRTKKPKQG